MSADSEIDIRRTGQAGRITLRRPDAMNALTLPMCLGIESALDGWRDDASVQVVVVDAEGDRAFCSGGDIAEMYEHGSAGDFEYGKSYWRDEYRLNAKIACYPKPIVSLMQGYTMGGGVGVGCHGSHRVVCENSRIAMPECGIGLVPDVGGSLILARAPGRTGEFLGVTGFRMGPDDAIFAGFADHFIPRERWAELIESLEESGDAGAVAKASSAPEPGRLRDLQPVIGLRWSGASLAHVASALEREPVNDFAKMSTKLMGGNSPLSMACAFELVRMQRSSASIEDALALEFRFTCRSSEHADFIEGIRARIIDKDGNPNWRFARISDVPESAVSELLSPLPDGQGLWEKAQCG